MDELLRSVTKAVSDSIEMRLAGKTGVCFLALQIAAGGELWSSN